MTNEEKEEEIALMLGIIIEQAYPENKEFRQSGKLYTLPKEFAKSVYENYIHTSNLHFSDNANWQFKAIKWVVETNHNISPRIHRMYFNTFRCMKNHLDFEFIYKIRIYSDFKDVDIKVNSNNEKEAIFEALYQFSQYLKKK